MTGKAGTTYLLDAGICRTVMARTNTSVVRRLVDLPVTGAAISSVTLSDLLYGAARSRSADQDRVALALFLQHVAVLDYPAGAAAGYAEVREALHWRQARLPAHDVLLSAQARAMGLTLVTERVGEFGMVPGLVVEGWGG